MEPPEFADLAEAAQAGLAGGGGCARYEGRVHQENRALGFTTVGDLVVHGTLADGTWTAFTLESQAWNNQSSMVGTQAGEHAYPFVLPFFGRFAGAQDEGRALFDELLDRMAVPVEIEEVGVAEGGWLYRRRLSSGWSLLRGRLDNVVESVHAAGGLRARSWHVQLEDPVKLDAGRITRLEARLEVDEAGRPRAETLQVRAGMGPLVLRVDRAITWTGLGECE